MLNAERLDAVGSVGFSPLKPLLLSVAGSRNFDDDASESSGSDDDSSEDEGAEVVIVKRRSNSMPVDVSINLWDFSSVQEGQ